MTIATSKIGLCNKTALSKEQNRTQRFFNITENALHNTKKQEDKGKKRAFENKRTFSYESQQADFWARSAFLVGFFGLIFSFFDFSHCFINKTTYLLSHRDQPAGLLALSCLWIQMVQRKPLAVAVTNMDPSDDIGSGNARKRSRRNAIKPNSADAMALMEFSVQYQLNNVSFEPPEEEERSKKARESSSDEESSRSGVKDEIIVATKTDTKPSSSSNYRSSGSSSSSSSTGGTICQQGVLIATEVSQEVVPKEGSVSALRIDDVVLTMVPFSSTPCSPTSPVKKSELKSSEDCWFGAAL